MFGVYNYSLDITKFKKYISILWHWPLTLNFNVKIQGYNIDIIYSFRTPRHRFSTYRHQKQVSTIYTTKYIILNALHHVCPWNSRSMVNQGHNIDINVFVFSDIVSVLIDIKHKFLQYILTEISYWMRYVMFDLEFQGQRSRSQH